MVNNESIALITRTTYSYNNSNVFYSLVNSVFLPYYQTVVRQSQQWLDGFAPEFHKDDMLSSRIAPKLMNGFSKSIFGRGLIYVKGNSNTEDDNKTLDFASKWSKDTNFPNTVKQLIGYTLPIGTSAIKTNRDGKGELWCEPLRMDYFYYTVDGRKRPIEFTSFVRCFSSTENKEENYFLVEKRYYKHISKPFEEEIGGRKFTFDAGQDVPMVCYKVYKYTGTVLNNTMPSSISGNSENYKTLPEYVKKAIKDNYGALMIDEEKPLPFTDLGVDLFFNEGGDITNPTLPVGRALVFDCLSDFAEYDMNKSYGVRDLYNSKGIVGVPRALNTGDLSKTVPGTGGNLTQNSTFAQLNIPGYEQVPGLDPNTQKPVITQFEIRAEEHEKKEDAILKSIAITVGVSPKTIASFLTTTTQATDDQIQSEDDSITQWIKDHRQDYVSGLNSVIERVLNYYGHPYNVEVKFASDGLLKTDKQLENISKRMELGMLTLEDAIREYYPDESEKQIQDRIAKAQAEKQLKEQKEQQQFLDSFGGFGENDINEQ